MAAEYDVFLSHDGADKAAVEAIATRLRDAGLRPFFEEWHLVPGDLRIPALEAASEGSPTIAVLIGPKGIEEWHEQQKQLAADERGKRVIPVLLAGVSRQSLQGFLGLRTVDFDEGNGFRRLVAGILGQAPELVA